MNNKVVKVEKINPDSLTALAKIKEYQEEKGITEEEAAIQLNKQIKTMTGMFAFGHSLLPDIDYVDLVKNHTTQEVSINLKNVIAVGVLENTPNYTNMTFPIYFSSKKDDVWWIDGDYYDLVMNKFEADD